MTRAEGSTCLKDIITIFVVAWSELPRQRLILFRVQGKSSTRTFSRGSSKITTAKTELTMIWNTVCCNRSKTNSPKLANYGALRVGCIYWIIRVALCSDSNILPILKNYNNLKENSLPAPHPIGIQENGQWAREPWPSKCTVRTQLPFNKNDPICKKIDPSIITIIIIIIIIIIVTIIIIIIVTIIIRVLGALR